MSHRSKDRKDHDQDQNRHRLEDLKQRIESLELVIHQNSDDKRN
jgi:hypothetical protein